MTKQEIHRSGRGGGVDSEGVGGLMALVNFSSLSTLKERVDSVASKLSGYQPAFEVSFGLLCPPSCQKDLACLEQSGQTCQSDH